MTIRVLAIDSHEVVLLGLNSLLKGTGIHLTATANSTGEAEMLLAAAEFDVVLTEVQLGLDDGLAVLKKIKSEYPRLPVLIFTAYDEPLHRARAFARGAGGCVLKHEQANRLIDSIRQVARGESAWSPDHLGEFRGTITGDSTVHLTDREGEVLYQLSHGLTNKEIAAMLEISAETVKDYIHNFFRKLETQHRTRAAVWAARKRYERSRRRPSPSPGCGGNK